MQHQRQTQIGSRESGMIPVAGTGKAHWNAKQKRDDGSVDIICSECGHEVNLPEGKTMSPELCRGCNSRMTNWSGLPIDYMAVTGEHRVPSNGTPCHDFHPQVQQAQPTESGEFPYNPT